MERFTRPMLGLIAMFAVFGCATPAGDGMDVSAENAALTAGERGLDLMLPFPAGETRQLTRGYGTAPTHLRHPGSPAFDDSYALDFAGDGCSSWNAPVLAAESGVVRYGAERLATAAERLALEGGYGGQQLFVDHGNGCVSHYAHLASRSVPDGASVRQGQEIGREGNLGSVEGGSCPAHPGTHLHFKVVCDGVAVKPEPLSGYRDLDRWTHRRFTHRALHHPVGTLVKAQGDPRIYAVCGPDRLCHVKDEAVFRSRRHWHDSRDEWGTVVTVDPDEIACHAAGPPITTNARLVATTCLGRMSSQVATYVAFEGDGVRWRKMVPFEPSQAGYRILLRSWGFRPDEVVQGDSSCGIPYDENDGHLSLRDGTVVEQASDDDFYVIADGGKAYRLYRNLMPVLYGTGWPQVIQVPDGSVPSLVRTVDHSHPEFTVTDATTCPNGNVTLVPGEGDATGGGTEPLVPDSDGAAGMNAPVPVPEPIPIPEEPAPSLPSPPSDAGQCGPPATAPTPTSEPVPVPVPEPMLPSNAAPRTLTCARSGAMVVVTIVGPVSDALVGPAPASPVAIKYGSDKDGWTDFGYGTASPKEQRSWSGEETYVLTLSADAGRFNFYLLGADGVVGWFDLPDADGDGVAWSVQGDCRMVCSTDSCALSF